MAANLKLNFGMLSNTTCDLPRTYYIMRSPWFLDALQGTLMGFQRGPLKWGQTRCWRGVGEGLRQGWGGVGEGLSGVGEGFGFLQRAR